VGLIGILDADKEGFLRDERSIIQTTGRAARNIDSKVILYADHLTDSIRKAKAETERPEGHTDRIQQETWDNAAADNKACEREGSRHKGCKTHPKKREYQIS